MSRYIFFFSPIMKKTSLAVIAASFSFWGMDAFSQTTQTLVCKKTNGKIIDSFTISVPFECKGNRLECGIRKEDYWRVIIESRSSQRQRLSRYSGTVDVSECNIGYLSHGESEHLSNENVLNECSERWVSVGQASCNPAKQLY